MGQVTSGYSEEMPKVTMGRGAVGTMGDSGTAGPSEESQLCHANRNHVRASHDLTCFNFALEFDCFLRDGVLRPFSGGIESRLPFSDCERMVPNL